MGDWDTGEKASGLRIVTFNVFLEAYQFVADWATRHGHRIVLLVTSPADTQDRYGSGYLRLVESVPATQDVLITSRLRRTAAPVIAALAPDLILATTFPHRIPPEITAIPRYGALNLHPAPLPRGRGPNPARLIYEGDTTVAGTLHRIAPDFDAGDILSRQERALPEDFTAETVFTAWRELLLAALDEGVPRAVAGEIGEAQDEALATYAAPFTEEERWLDWNEPTTVIQRRVAALNMPVPTARGYVDGESVIVAGVRPVREVAPAAAPGTVLGRDGETVTVRAGDGVVEIETRPVVPEGAVNW